MVTGIFVFLGAILRTLGAVAASRVLHADCLHNIIRSPMQFFDTTPLGRIVNRFAKDIDVIDIMIPMQVGMFLICLMSVLSTIVVVSISTPLFMTVIFPLGVLYFLLQVNVA